MSDQIYCLTPVHSSQVLLNADIDNNKCSNYEEKGVGFYRYVKISQLHYIHKLTALDKIYFESETRLRVSL